MLELFIFYIRSRNIKSIILRRCNSLIRVYKYNINSLTPEIGPHFNDVEFGCFSGNMSLISWFKNLCRL